MKHNAFRLPSGGAIDRSRPLRFRFNGWEYVGYEGDTLASALLANGVSLTGRSFKYHRPRGIVGAGVEEPASLVELQGGDASANQPITAVRLREGLDARSVNCWPSPSFDLMAINQLFSGLLPAAFYYKTFMWPDWHLFEPFIRRAAGLAGAPARRPDKGRYESRNWHCDVLVVGAGPAGLMAALTAGRAGCRVVLVDDQSEPGGSLLACRTTIDGLPGVDWAAKVAAELDAMPDVVRLTDATAWAVRENNYVLVTERSPDVAHLLQRTWRIRARRLIVAAGAIERMLVFEGNDRPGVMLASAARRYVNRHAVVPGRRAVIFANNSSAYDAAGDLAAAGIAVEAIVDARPHGAPGQERLPAGTQLRAGHVVAKAHGRRRVDGVAIRPIDGGRSEDIDCDLLCLSGGWSPTVHLFSQSRGPLVYDETIAAFRPGPVAGPFACAGGADGIFDLGGAMASGVAVAGTAIAALGTSSSPAASDLSVPATPGETPYDIHSLWHVDGMKPGAKAFVDIQNDVTLSDVHLAIREGYGAVEHVKRYTTAGMGFDQGKTGNINVVGSVARRRGIAMEAVGTTTFRPPYVPVEFGAIAGLREESVILPYRHTPLTAWHVERGATMYEAGARWRRPGYYPLPGESFQETVDRESRVVREGAGIYDGSPLGKFDIQGRDAARLLDMLYTNDFASLATGMGRYGLMLSDDGLILDDGVTIKLADDHYWMSTSTGNADLVYRHIEHFLQIERPEWDVRVTTMTTRWANATVCGPKAREVMEAAGTDLDLSPSAFPFMAMREGRVAGIPARVCRVSFTGELSFEVNVRSRDALALWEALMAAGKAHGITPVGSEGNHVLRVEKGFLSLGHEADGTVDAFDLGMGWIVSKTKEDFIGKRAMEIRRAGPAPRRELVGLLPADPSRLVAEGAPLTPGGRREPSEGLVTACVWSVVAGRTVALGLLANGRARHGETVHARMKEDIAPMVVTRPCFHDPKGERLRG
ncbi:MAG: sarcosine oxidase subunit alpha family protein [Rhizobiales bacterium]|nr:sarcosine oxidase subunit alpha family protein [Hyphomicrobiales bacterium]